MHKLEHLIQYCCPIYTGQVHHRENYINLSINPTNSEWNELKNQITLDIGSQALMMFHVDIKFDYFDMLEDYPDIVKRLTEYVSNLNISLRQGIEDLYKLTLYITDRLTNEDYEVNLYVGNSLNDDSHGEDDLINIPTDMFGNIVCCNDLLYHKGCGLLAVDDDMLTRLWKYPISDDIPYLILDQVDSNDIVVIGTWYSEDSLSMGVKFFYELNKHDDELMFFNVFQLSEYIHEHILSLRGVEIKSEWVPLYNQPLVEADKGSPKTVLVKDYVTVGSVQLYEHDSLSSDYVKVGMRNFCNLNVADFKHKSNNHIVIHPLDADWLGISNGDLIMVIPMSK